MPSLRATQIGSPDPTAPELAGVFVITVGLEEPFDWDAEFRSGGPLQVEIGPGKGDWLERMGGVEPGTRWVGIEYKQTRARHIARKLARRGLRNVRIIWHEALEALESLFPPGSVDAVHVNFPDPWPKRRHRKRRLVQAAFCEVVLRALRPGGRLLLVTDVADYAEQMLEEVEKSAGFENELGPGAIAPSDATFIPTIHYLKFAERGRSFHFLRFRKRPS